MENKNDVRLIPLRANKNLVHEANTRSAPSEIFPEISYSNTTNSL